MGTMIAVAQRAGSSTPRPKPVERMGGTGVDKTPDAFVHRAR
jgi:hypothetical protein